MSDQGSIPPDAGATAERSVDGAAASAGNAADGPLRRSEVVFNPGNVWRAGLALLGVAALGSFLAFVLDDGGSVLFTVLMSWFAALAMAPLVNRLAKHMKRGLATILVMLAFLVFVVFFFLAFGQLLLDQLVELVKGLPALIESVITWVNETFDQDLQASDIRESLGLTPEEAASLAAQIGGQALSILGSVVGSVFSMFTFGLFTFYLSADWPRLRMWIASLFPARAQGVMLTAVQLTGDKTGGYVGARVILAGINSATTAVVFLLIDMPYWLPLALWTGIVAQFVPTIGTYISIILPVLVGLLSDNPLVGVYALVWALVYQQVENLTIEPRISAKAVDVHPAVAFGAVMLGAALFGVSGAFLAVPVCAMILAMVGIYGKRHEVLPLGEAGAAAGGAPAPVGASGMPEAPTPTA